MEEIGVNQAPASGSAAVADPDRIAITIDAVTGSTVEIFELKPPAEILMDEELK